MAFPSVRSSQTSTGSATTHSLTLPATISNGDLLLAILSSDGGTSMSYTWDNTTEGTWTNLYEDTNGGAGSVRTTVYAKVADGTETGPLSITKSISDGSTGYVASIQDWEGTLSGVTTGTVAKGISTLPDPPSVTAAGGSGDNLFIAIASYDAAPGTSAYPTNYNDNQTSIQNGSSAASIAVATRSLTAATDDPGTFTLGGSEQWIANTLVVEPAGGGGGSVPLYSHHYTKNLA